MISFILAEEVLTRIEKENNRFSLELLDVARGSNSPANLAAAIYLKNLVKKEWAPPSDILDEPIEQPIGFLPMKERKVLRMALLNSLKTVSHHAIMPHISESVSLIAMKDFVDGDWPEFLPFISEILSITNIEQLTLYGGLLVCNSIFSRYRSEFRTDALFTEINAVLGSIAKPLLVLFELNAQRLLQPSGPNTTHFKEDLKQLRLILDIFYSLSIQDIPAFFEENFFKLSPIMEAILTMRNMVSDTGSDPNALSQVQVGICEFIRLYATRYEEEIGELLPSLVMAILRLLADVSMSTSDILVGEALGVIAAVSKRVRFASLFSVPETLSAITERIILPALLLPTPIGMLEEYMGTLAEAAEYAAGCLTQEHSLAPCQIRRHSAEDVLHGLMATYPQLMGALLSHFFFDSGSKANADWRLREASICVQIACLSQVVDILAAFERDVFPLIVGFYDTGKESRSLGTPSAFLFLAAMRFCLVFDKQLQGHPQRAALAILCMDRLVLERNPLLHVAAALFLEKFIAVPLIPKGQSGAFLNCGVEKIVETIGSLCLQDEIYEPEILMRLVARLLVSSGSESLQESQVFKIAEILWRVIVKCGPSPKRPGFSRWLWEVVGIIAGNYPAQARLLMPLVQGTLSEGYSEYLSYALLVLGILIGVSDEINPDWISLVDVILAPGSYQPALVTPLTRALESFVSRILFFVPSSSSSSLSALIKQSDMTGYQQAFWRLIGNVMLVHGAGPLKLLAAMRLLRCCIIPIDIAGSEEIDSTINQSVPIKQAVIQLCRGVLDALARCRSMAVLGRLSRPFYGFLVHLGAVGLLETVLISVGGRDLSGK